MADLLDIQPPPDDSSPRDESKEYKRALTFIKIGQLDKAREVLEDYVQQNPESVRAINKYAFVLVELGKARAAKYLLQSLIAKGQRDFYTHFLLGRTFHREGNLPVAIQQYRNALTLKPDDIYTINGLAQALRESGQAPSAVTLLAKGLAISREDPTTFVQLAGLFLELGDFESSSKWIEQGLQTHPAALSLRCLRAEWHAKKGDLAAARTTYEQVARDFPASAEGKLGLSRVLDQQGKTTEALRELGLAMSVDPKNSTVNREYARLLVRTGDSATALSVMQRAVDLAPKDHRVLTDMAEILIEHRLRLKAYMMLKKAVALRNEFPNSHALIGRLFLDEELYEQAREELAYAHGLKPDDGEIRGLLAEAMARAGACDAAREMVAPLLAAEPAGRQARLVMALSALGTGDAARAEPELTALAAGTDRVSLAARSALAGHGR